MDIIQQAMSLKTNSAKTSDWIGQIEDGVIYAYDLGNQASQSAGCRGFIKGALEQTPAHVSRKNNSPIGEHIREAIKIIKGSKD